MQRSVNNTSGWGQRNLSLRHSGNFSPDSTTGWTASAQHSPSSFNTRRIHIFQQINIITQAWKFTGKLTFCQQRHIPCTLRTLKLNLHHLRPQHTLFDGSFKMAEAPYEYDNIKMWEANRVRKWQAPEAEKETSSNACRSVRFLPVPLFFFCFLIIFSGGMKPVFCTPHSLDVLLKHCPPSIYSSFCPHPKKYVYEKTPLICLLLLFCWIDFPVEDMCGIWSICLSDSFQSAQFKRCQRHADQFSGFSS